MTTTSHISTDRSAVYSDLNGLQDIRKLDRKDSKQAMGAIGKQFESMFTSMMLKSMREANKGFEDGNFGHGQATEFYRDMFDQQLALSLSHGRGIGLSDTLTRQLQTQYKKGSAENRTALNADSRMGDNRKLTALDREKPGLPLPGTAADKSANTGKLSSSRVASMNTAGKPMMDKPMVDKHGEPLERAYRGTPEKIEFSTATAGIAADSHEDWLNEIKVVSDVRYAAARPVARMSSQTVQTTPTVAGDSRASTSFENQEAFVNHLLPIIRQHAEPMGLDARAILAQAALETGWGKHVIRDENGRNSFNLFGIKSGGSWSGDVAQANTSEYYNGKLVREDAGFRSYHSYADSVRDYVKLIAGSDNYRNAVRHAAEPKNYFRSLQQSGYATDPRYAEKLWNIYNSDAIQTAAADSGQAPVQSVRAMQMMSAVRSAMQASAALSDTGNRG